MKKKKKGFQKRRALGHKRTASEKSLQTFETMARPEPFTPRPSGPITFSELLVQIILWSFLLGVLPPSMQLRRTTAGAVEENSRPSKFHITI